MRNGPAALHHLAPSARLSPRGMAGFFVTLQRDIWCQARGAALALARRPLLALTLAIVIVLLCSTVGETLAARRLDEAVARAQAQNAALQAAIAHTNDQILQQTTPAAIIAAARRLGWEMAPRP